MLFGVAVFSHILANYIVIIEKMNKTNQDIGEADKLILFFATLKYYNKNKLFNLKMKEKIEEYFQYRWENDRNAAICMKSDLVLLAELPHDVQDRLLCSFLFSDFIQTFRSFFRLPKENQGGLIMFKSRPTMFTWQDQFYRDFMSELIRRLEPWYTHARATVFAELDEFGEIIFVNQGVIGLGFEINKMTTICIQSENNCVIGSYGLTFNQRSAYTYKALTACRGYFIRKERWKVLLQWHPEIAKVLKQQILLTYILNIRAKVELKKKKFRDALDQRADHQMIQYSDNKFEKLQLYEQVYKLGAASPQHLHEPGRDDKQFQAAEGHCPTDDSGGHHDCCMDTMLANMAFHLINTSCCVSFLLESIERRDRQILELHDSLRNLKKQRDELREEVHGGAADRSPFASSEYSQIVDEEVEEESDYYDEEEYTERADKE